MVTPEIEVGTGFGVFKFHWKVAPVTEEVNVGTVIFSPPQKVVFVNGEMVMSGFGFTTIEYSNDGPTQPLEVGITAYVSVWFTKVGFVKVITGRFPVPEVVAPVILPVFELIDQLYVESIVLVHVTRDVAVSEQIVWELFELFTDGNSLTVTVTVLVLLQVPSSPLTVYVVVSNGETLTLLPNVGIMFVVGVQVNFQFVGEFDVWPVASKSVDEFLQISVEEGDIVKFGLVLITNSTDSSGPAQPSIVPFTLYIPAWFTLDATKEKFCVVFVKPFGSIQLYFAGVRGMDADVKLALSPIHTVAVGERLLIFGFNAGGKGLT